MKQVILSTSWMYPWRTFNCQVGLPLVMSSDLSSHGPLVTYGHTHILISLISTSPMVSLHNICIVRVHVAGKSDLDIIET